MNPTISSNLSSLQEWTSQFSKAASLGALCAGTVAVSRILTEDLSPLSVGLAATSAYVATVVANKVFQESGIQERLSPQARQSAQVALCVASMLAVPHVVGQAVGAPLSVLDTVRAGTGAVVATTLCALSSLGCVQLSEGGAPAQQSEEKVLSSDGEEPEVSETEEARSQPESVETQAA